MMRSFSAITIAFLLVLSMSARAEDSANAVPTLPPPPEIEGTIELPKTSPMDRQKSTAQVKALQLMEANRSGMMCQMMRQMAMKEPNQTNKMMMMMMAQQSCDSSDASKKAAEENDKNRKLISQEDVPKMQKLKAKPLPLDFGQSKGTDETQNLDAFKVKLDESFASNNDSIPTTSSTDLAAALSAAGVRTEVVSANDLANAAREAEDSSAPAPKGLSTSALQGIANADGKSPANGDDVKSAGPGNGPGGIASLGGGGGGAAGAGSADGKTASANGVPVATSDRKANRETDGGAGGGGGGGESAPKSGGNEAFDALLAQMLGGPPAASEENGFNAGETVGMGAAGKSVPTTNIFEYASLRFKRLSTTNRVLAQSRTRNETKNQTKVAAAKELEAALVAADSKSATLVDRKPAGVAVEPPVTEPRRASLR